MEERNLELDDDGKIKIRKNAEAVPAPEEESAEGEIVIDVPDFEGFREEQEGGLTSDAELARRSEERERERAEKKQLAERTYEEAEKLFAAGDLDGAGEKFLDSASLYGGDWRAWFGVVRVQTKDLTDFSGIYDCEQAYDKAFRRMTAEDRHALAEKYAERLKARAAELEKERESYSAEDDALREKERPAVLAACKKAILLFTCFLVAFAACIAAGSVFSGLVYDYEGNTFLILTILCFALALGLFVAVVAFGKRLVVTRIERSKNLRAGTTSAGEKARICAEEEELILSIVEDMTK